MISSEADKADLNIYMEGKHLLKMNLTYQAEKNMMESMAVRCQKELNAMRSSLQLAMNYSKLEQTQGERDRARKKRETKCLILILNQVLSIF